MKKTISKPHLDLLKKPAKQVFGDLPKFVPKGVLGGGTAVMLLLGHRKSFDLDIFLPHVVSRQLLVKLKSFYGERLLRPLVDTADELSVIIAPSTKLSFIFFPFKPLHKLIETDSIPFYSLEDLASNKAYVIGRRGAWRDYVDFFFLIRELVSRKLEIRSGLKFARVIGETKKRFGGAFSQKLFLEQLTYYGDITDFTVDYIGQEYKPQHIQEYLKKLTRSYLKL